MVFLGIGFTKEQLRVSTEGRNMIRVRGERLLGGNKWIRFLEDYEVPENSDMNSVRAKFHEGALTITIPKKILDKLHDFATGKKDVGTSHVAKQGPAHDDQSKESVSSKQKHTETWRAEDNEKKTVAKEERKSEGSKDLGEEEKIKPKRDDGATVKDKGKEGKKEGIIESSRAEHGVGEKGKEGKKKEVTETSRAEHGVAEKVKEGRKKVVEWSQAEHGALAKAMKGASELGEERRLMVNMGAAVLVIASLSAYVTYKFVARDDKK